MTGKIGGFGGIPPYFSPPIVLSKVPYQPYVKVSLSHNRAITFFDHMLFMLMLTTDYFTDCYRNDQTKTFK